MPISTCFFSIVIPTYNRHDQLRSTLAALTHLDYTQSEFEVIAVDDGSVVSIDSIVAEFQDHLDLTLVKLKNGGPARARTQGAFKASGRFLVFIDDDCLPEKSWLQALAAALQKSPESICGGKTVNFFPNNPYSTAHQLLQDYFYENYRPGKEPGAFFPTNNFAVPRERFIEMGGFDQTLRYGEDRDFCFRWESKGGDFVFVPDAVVYHTLDLNFRSFLKRHFAYGGGSYHFWKNVAKRNPGKIKLGSFSFYSNLMLTGIRSDKSPQGLWLSLLLVFMETANTVGFFWEAIKSAVGK